ncbi:MAG: hypothetical protein JXL97_03605 [Bacteroidales bacterium]|nr:hypothetical protein [Bacteroidales bacterium]
MDEEKLKNIQKKSELQEMGRKSRQRGMLFEVKVREDLESKGWIVTKWMNTVDFERDKVGPARRKFNPFTKSLSIGTGFPDLLCFKKNGDLFEVIGVEVKTGGLLDKFEKGQALWYLEKGIIPRILIAKKEKDENNARKVVVEYIDFEEKYVRSGKLNKKMPKNLNKNN